MVLLYLMVINCTDGEAKASRFKDMNCTYEAWNYHSFVYDYWNKFSLNINVSTHLILLFIK
jgi:hypothetical protein